MINLNFLKKNKSLKKENFQINFQFYWTLLLIILVIAILFASFLGYYLFTKASDEKEVSEESIIIKQQEIIKKERIDKVLEYFLEKEKKSSDILNSGVPIIDPSR
jgi:hypothetical protein